MPAIRFIKSWLHPLVARPRLLLAIGVGILIAMLLPSEWGKSTRFLISWSLSASVYLSALFILLRNESLYEIKAKAAQQDEGSLTILIVTCLAAVASVAAIGVEFSGLDIVSREQKPWHLALGILTIIISWVLVHTLFSLHYANYFYRSTDEEEGFDFPGTSEPDYVDFLYFSFTVGCTSQTSDVSVTKGRARIIVLFHSVLSFFFNTSILALGINVSASLLSGN